MTCTKVGCQKQDEEIEKATIGAIVVIACREHSDDLRTDGHVQELFRRQARSARQLSILIDALKGPAANVQACMLKLDEVMEAEKDLQDAVERWLNTAAGLPS
jgi:hypothetical protein